MSRMRKKLAKRFALPSVAQVAELDCSLDIEVCFESNHTYNHYAYLIKASEVLVLSPCRVSEKSCEFTTHSTQSPYNQNGFHSTEAET